MFNFSTAILLLGLACFVLIDHVRGCYEDSEEGGDVEHDAVEEEENSEGDNDNEDAAGKLI